jgi:non-homologous end joining protein Ku
MPAKVSRPSLKTHLKIGGVVGSISLYKAIGDGKNQKWESADADGNPWKPKPAAEALPEPPGDPLGGESTPEPQKGTGAPIGGAVPPAGEAPESEVPLEMSAEPEKPRKGIRKADGAFVDLTDEIEGITERTTMEQMEIVSFISRSHVPRERIIGTYFVAGGDGDGLPPLRLLQTLVEAMRETSTVAVVRFSKRKGQTLGVLTVRRDGAILLLELCFAEHFRAPNPKCLAHTHAETKPEEVEQAGRLIMAMAGRRDDLDGIRDLRAWMEEELVKRAEEGELDDYELPAEQVVETESSELGDLLAAAVAQQS